MLPSSKVTYTIGLVTHPFLHRLNARLGGTNSRAGSSFWDNVMNQLGAYMVMGKFHVIPLIVQANHSLQVLMLGIQALGHRSPQ